MLEPLQILGLLFCNTSFHLPERSSLRCAHCGPDSANVIYSPDSNCTTIPIVRWAHASNKLPIEIATQKRPLLWPYPLGSNLDLGGTSVASDVPLNSILESKATVRRDKPLRFNPKGKKQTFHLHYYSTVVLHQCTDRRDRWRQVDEEAVSEEPSFITTSNSSSVTSRSVPFSLLFPRFPPRLCLHAETSVSVRPSRHHQPSIWPARLVTPYRSCSLASTLNTPILPLPVLL